MYSRYAASHARLAAAVSRASRPATGGASAGVDGAAGGAPICSPTSRMSFRSARCSRSTMRPNSLTFSVAPFAAASAPSALSDSCTNDSRPMTLFSFIDAAATAAMLSRRPAVSSRMEAASGPPEAQPASTAANTAIDDLTRAWVARSVLAQPDSESVPETNRCVLYGAAFLELFAGKSDREARAASGLALHGEPAAHALAQLTRQRKAETRAAEAPALGVVHLLERLEDPVDLIPRN